MQSPLKILSADAAEDAYPEFQLDARLNHSLLSSVELTPSGGRLLV